MSFTKNGYHFLQEGGEMGQLIREKDWTQTPLGQPASWSQSLKQMVRVMLDNPFAMYIAWGNDLTQIYNDAFRPILGKNKHPQALGASAKETFSEIWEITGPMLARVMHGEAISRSNFKLPINRNGIVEECYFDFSYSPIRMDNGKIGGILTTVMETTMQQKALAAVEERNDELQFVIESAQLGTFDYNPKTDRFSGNARLRNWFGLPLEGEIELKDAIDAIAENDRNRIVNAIQEVLKFESGGNYNVKFKVIHRITNKVTHVHAKGRTWFNEDKMAYRFTGTVEDITEQTLANIKTKEAESHIRTMILESPVGICVLDANTLICETVNDSFVQIVGKSRNQILGDEYWNTFADVKNDYFEVLNTVIETGEAFTANEVEITFIHNHKPEKFYISFVYAPLKNENDKVVKVAVWVQNDTPQVLARKEIMVSERNLRLMILQAPLAIAIFRGKDYTIEIANRFALELWDKKEEEVLNIPIMQAIPELESQGIDKLLDEVTNTGKRFFTSEMPVKLIRDKVLKTIYINFSFEPLYGNDGNINGIMAIGFDITEQVEARKKIEASEQSIRALVESAPFPIGVYQGEELRITLANQSIIDIWGKGNDVIGKLWTDILPELKKQKIFDQIRQVFHTGRAYHAKNQKVHLLKNGALTPFYFNYSFTPLIDAEGQVYAVMNTAAEVTELNEAKLRVEENEKRFRDSVKQAPIGIAIFRGRDYKAELANDSYLQLIDKTEEEFLGKPMFESIPEVEENLAPIVEEIFRTGEDYHGYEFQVNFDRNGIKETKYFNFFYHPLQENKEITGFMVVASDVTSTVKAKQLILENQEKLNLVIDGSELGIYDVDLTNGKIEASERCYEILGFKGKKDLTNEELLANFFPDDLAVRKLAFEKAYKSGKLMYQARVVWNDNAIHWMDVNGKIFFDANGNPQRILGTVRDITEEKTFQQELLEREEKFRLLADSMPQYIWTADPDGNLDYFNQSMYDFTGLAPGQLNDENWVQMVHPDDRERNMARWKQSIKTGENYLFEQRFRKHDGEFRWQLSRAIPQRDIDGVIKRWVGTSTDIQEQKMFAKELEKQVKARTNELEQKNVDLEKMNKELESFVYISSHDLQEPLRKIQMFSSRLVEMEYDTLSENGKKHFEKIQNSAFRMQQLIRDLISYSRTNVKETNYEIVDLQEIIDDVKETLSEELAKDKVHFELCDICEVKIIPVQFRQVILNLISNSIKFAQENQPLVITIQCTEVKGEDIEIVGLSKEINYTHIRYKDNGIGFEQAYNEKIFEVFQRLHSRHTYSGTGIGLAIVKRIIENHEGDIIANGVPKEGATFDIYLPAP